MTGSSWHSAVIRSGAWVSPALCLALPARRPFGCSLIELQADLAAFIIDRFHNAKMVTSQPVLAKASLLKAFHESSEHARVCNPALDGFHMLT